MGLCDLNICEAIRFLEFTVGGRGFDPRSDRERRSIDELIAELEVIGKI